MLNGRLLQQMVTLSQYNAAYLLHLIERIRWLDCNYFMVALSLTRVKIRVAAFPPIPGFYNKREAEI
jgi:hypothetical protein